MKKLTTSEFIEKATSIHGNLYSYDIAKYKSNKLPIDIICSVHGVFTQAPGSHLTGHGCNKCAITFRASKERQTQEEYIRKASLKHKGFYTYENLIYTDVHTKSTITCPIHGNFTQKLNSHLAGQGCKECGKKAAGNSKTFFKGKRTILYVIEVRPGLYKVGITSKGSVEARYKHKTLYPYTILFQCSFLDGYEAFLAESAIVSHFKKYSYLGAPVLKKTKNTEIITVSPIQYIQSYLKDTHANSAIVANRD